jgi:hypothetical protein
MCVLRSKDAINSVGIGPSGDSTVHSNPRDIDQAMKSGKRRRRRLARSGVKEKRTSS